MKYARLALVTFASLGLSAFACSSDSDGGGPGGAAGSGRGGSGAGGQGTGGSGTGGASSGGSGGAVGGTGGGGAGGAAAGSGGRAGADAAGQGGSGGREAGGADSGSGGAPAEAGSGPDGPPPDLAAVMACPRPSVDRLELWQPHAGGLRPGVGGNLLVKEGDAHHMKVEFLPSAAWHEVVVPVANSLTRKADLSASRGFIITYSATAELWVQLRPLSRAHGGDQHTAHLPATGGMVKELFVPFDAATFSIPLLGKPPFPFSQAVKDANFFNFVGRPAVANTFIVRGLRFDGYLPPCS